MMYGLQCATTTTVDYNDRIIMQYFFRTDNTVTQHTGNAFS